MSDTDPSLSRLRLLALLAAPAIPAIVMAVILTSHTRNWTTERATANAAHAAGLVADFAISPVLRESDFSTTTSDPQRVNELDALLRPFLGDDILRIKIWDATGRVVYSDDHDGIGVVHPVSDELAAALRGESSSEISKLDGAENLAEQEFDRLLEVYVPVGTVEGGGFVGAFELYLPYDPIAEAIRADTRRIYGMLAVTLLLLFGALAQIVVLWERSRRRAERHEHQANHDPLTGLVNRRKFQATLAALTSGRPEQSVAVLFIDLDDFKTVNDQFGHHRGDELLVAVAGRLRDALRGDATLARLGGDEFAVLIPRLDDPSHASEIASRLIECLRAPVRLGDLRIEVQASIGIDVMTGDRIDPLQMQRNADAAMYMAKGAGKARYATFDPVLDGHLHSSQDQARSLA